MYYMLYTIYYIVYTIYLRTVGRPEAARRRKEELTDRPTDRPTD